MVCSHWIYLGGFLMMEQWESTTVGTTPIPRAASTPIYGGDREGVRKWNYLNNWSSTLGEDVIPPLDTFLNPNHQTIADETSVTTLGDKDHIDNDEEYQEMVPKLAKVSKKHRLVLKNWSLERKATASALAKERG